jgi:hypothetical protein
MMQNTKLEIKKMIKNSSEILEKHYEFDFLISLIILRGKLNGIKEGMTRFHIAKVLAWVLVNSEVRSIQANVFIYKYGPYVLKFEGALAELMRRNIMEIVKDKEGQTRFCITEEGQSWVMARLRDQNYKKSATILREIDNYLFIPIPDLIMEIAEKSPLLCPIKRKIGDRELIRIFDWKNFGDGKIHGYHYTLLRSFYGLENYFDKERNKAEERIERGNTNYQFRIVDYSTIAEVLQSNDIKNISEKHSICYLFNKENPKNIRENKFEAKNYIGHLWYIYGAINIIHVLAGLAPTIDEIARVCLTHYEYAIKEGVPYPERRRMREGAIRSDIQKLVKYGILNKKKVSKRYVYSIRAKKIIDSVILKEYSLLDDKKIKDLYEKNIRPSPKNAKLIKQIRSIRNNGEEDGEEY